MANTFTYSPDAGSQRSEVPNMDRINFGNNYVQKVASDINSLVEEWSWKFTTNDTDKQAIIAFFKANYQTYFLWTTEETGGTQKPYEVLSWSVVGLGANMYTVTATIKEWAGLI